MDSLPGFFRVRAVAAGARTLLFNLLRPHVGRALFGTILLAGATASVARAVTWEPIPPAELTSTTPAVQADADAEYIYWRAFLIDDSEGASFKYEVRAKIYTARGVENAGKLHIDRPRGAGLYGLVARVVKPDGKVIELKKGDFIESEIAKQGDQRWIRTSFAFPTLSPGDIVDYRWRLQIDDGNPAGWYFCQQLVPVREYAMEISARFGNLNVAWFNVSGVEQKKMGDSRLRITVRNLPAFVEEPFMTPELDSRGWIRLSYAGTERDPGKAWQVFTDEAGDFFARETKPNDAIRKKAQELVAGAADDETKIRRIFDFCHDGIINVHWSDSPVAREERQRKEARDFQSAKETLSRGFGRTNEINYLFAALLRGAGFQPHRVLNAPNYFLLNSRIVQGWNFMTSMNVGLERNGTWSYYAPGDRFVAYGMLDRFDEGTSALVVAEKKSAILSLPISPAVMSQRQRRARLVLDAEGGLSGEVTVTYTGHEAVTERRTSWDKSESDLAKEVTDAVHDRLPSAEVSEVRWENLREAAGPVVLHYKVNVPGYAEAAGQRLVVVPGYFSKGLKPLFTAPQRVTRLMWYNAGEEHDDIEIDLPAGFALEQATSPASVREDNDLLYAKYTIGYAKRRHTIIYKRDYVMSEKSGLIFPASVYPAFKSLYERINRSDTHSVVLRPAPAEPAAPPAPSPAAAPAS